jgi:hypothetical protein
VQRKMEIMADANLSRGIPRKALLFIVCPAITAVIASGAKQSIAPRRKNGLLRGACHPAALRADRVARNDEEETPCTTSPSTEKPISTAGAKPPARWR